MASGTLFQPFPSDVLRIWKYSFPGTSGEINLPNGFRGILFTNGGQNDAKSLTIISCTSAGTVRYADISIPTGLTFTTGTNKLTITYSSTGLSLLMFCTSGFVESVTTPA